MRGVETEGERAKERGERRRDRATGSLFAMARRGRRAAPEKRQVATTKKLHTYIYKVLKQVRAFSTAISDFS